MSLVERVAWLQLIEPFAAECPGSGFGPDALG
jgi:hypothetical protein